MTQSRTGKAAREERERMLILKHRFDNRITTAKFGKQSLDIADYASSIKKFTDYLLVMAEVKRVKDIYSLTPDKFNHKTELTEMMMISHIYLELARMYDAIPKFHDDSKKCLDQFVRFSANQPYQIVNSELIRKHLKKTKFKNPDAFRMAYQQIFIQSKKCFVVTFCYGDAHPITNEFRAFKDVLLEYSLGRELVRNYYRFSSLIVTRYEDNALAKAIASYLVSPLLLLFSKTLLRFIMKR
jgi:hypothetical protein